MRRCPIRPLSITVKTEHGQTIVVAATFSRGRDAAPLLLLQGGLWRIEIPEEEARRLAAFAAGWWTP